jgi:anti-anti-sigma factor
VTCCATPHPRRLAFVGEVDIALEGSLAAVHSFVLHSAPSDVAICLHDVTFLDSTGLDFLVRTQEQVQATGHTLRLVAPSATVRWVLRIAELLTMFQIEDAAPGGLAHCECRFPRIDGVRAVVPGQRAAGMEGATG